MAANGTKHLYPGEAAGRALGLLPEEAPERRRLGLRDDQLYQRRRIEIDQDLLPLP